MLKSNDTLSSVGDRTYKVFQQARTHSTCTRCGGLMVNDVCLDLLNDTSELECTARRCVQCGDIIDSVILRNRSLHQQSVAIQHQPASVH